MSESDNSKMPPVEILALGTSGTILIVLALYWIVQIGNVVTMLKLAYG